MSVPLVKGWCPGAYKPMASGDGLVVRVRPWLGEVTATQALALCAVAERYGTGTLALTNRANLQVRGVAEADHRAVVEALLEADLLDRDPIMEGRRNLLMAPEWRPGDAAHGVAEKLLEALPQFPELPAKFGYAVDIGPSRWLADAPADIRFEGDASGDLLLVADGAGMGRAVTPATALPALVEMITWFIDTGGRDAGRMARHLRNGDLPADWQQAPRRGGQRPQVCAGGTLLGVPFGQIDTTELRSLIKLSAPKAFRILPGRLLLAMGAWFSTPEAFCAPDDPVLNVHACTGAPGCPQALGPTQSLARALARTVVPGETLHISGCSKGCAHPRVADRTYVATRVGFNLVTQGAPWDAPCVSDLSTDAILNKTPQG